MSGFKLDAIPAEMGWINSPADWKADPDGGLTIRAGEKTDWFIDPAGTPGIGNAPAAMFAPPDADFILSARVTVEFGATFDAGVLFLHAAGDVWAKLCFEFSPQGRPMVVSVVTRGVSDDCNSAVIDGREVWLRVSRNEQTVACHYSLDGRLWHMVRYFTLGEAGLAVRAGFEAQSPVGAGCTVRFTEIRYRAGRIADLRSGE